MELIKEGVEKLGCGIFFALVGVVAFVPIAMTILHGFFAFANPDEPAWYGLTESGQPRLFATLEEGTAGSALGLIDIHSRLVNWFLWGFIIALSPFGAALLT